LPFWGWQAGCLHDGAIAAYWGIERAISWGHVAVL